VAKSFEVADLLALGVSVNEAAQLLSAHRVTVYRWRVCQEPSARARQVLQLVADLVARVGASNAAAQLRRRGVVLRLQPGKNGRGQGDFLRP
jgi:hypothetical protein